MPVAERRAIQGDVAGTDGASDACCRRQDGVGADQPGGEVDLAAVAHGQRVDGPRRGSGRYFCSAAQGNGARQSAIAGQSAAGKCERLLDSAVDVAYRCKPGVTEMERMALLFTMYKRLTAPETL